MLKGYFDEYVQNYSPYKEGNWCYEDGCIYRGLELLHQATGEARWFDHLKRLVDAQLTQSTVLKGYDPSEYNIDNILSGRALLYLDAITEEDQYMNAARLLGDQLSTHPRTESGVYWHKLRYPSQIWLDGLYMGPPFQIGYGKATANQALIDDALAQVSTALDKTFNLATGLYVHATDEAREQPWADPTTGHSSAHWSRAMGWLAMGLVDIAELVGPDAFGPLKDRTTALLNNILNLRNPDGLWLQVINYPDLPGNYSESSASAMFVYALIRGTKLGLCDCETETLFGALTQKVVQQKPSGGYEMIDICHVAGLGTYQNRYRDGSPGYYVTEPRVADDAKGVGPLMMGFAALQ